MLVDDVVVVEMVDDSHNIVGGIDYFDTQVAGVDNFDTQVAGAGNIASRYTFHLLGECTNVVAAFEVHLVQIVVLCEFEMFFPSFQVRAAVMGRIVCVAVIDVVPSYCLLVAYAATVMEDLAVFAVSGLLRIHFD